MDRCALRASPLGAPSLASKSIYFKSYSAGVNLSSPPTSSLNCALPPLPSHPPVVVPLAPIAACSEASSFPGMHRYDPTSHPTNSSAIAGQEHERSGDHSRGGDGEPSASSSDSYAQFAQDARDEVDIPGEYLFCSDRHPGLTRTDPLYRGSPSRVNLPDSERRWHTQTTDECLHDFCKETKTANLCCKSDDENRRHQQNSEQRVEFDGYGQSRDASFVTEGALMLDLSPSRIRNSTSIRQRS